MNETVKEWIAKAHGDYRTASRELAATLEPNYDAVCFHAQQCLEKMFKAVLLHHGQVPPRTHDLVFLHALVRQVRPEAVCDDDDLRFLTRAAVEFRYPGESADLAEASESFRICEEVFALLPELFIKSEKHS
jgi:HEPN domain-containing protein